jgi:hypothetical protein
MLAITDISRADGVWKRRGCCGSETPLHLRHHRDKRSVRISYLSECFFSRADATTRSSETIAMRLTIVTYGHNGPSERAVREVRKIPCLS